jgi:hypothetical protein
MSLPRGETPRNDIARSVDRVAVKVAWECEALADALVPAARQLGIDAAAQVELLIAFRDVGNLPASWSLATPLAQWAGVALSEQGSVTKFALIRSFEDQCFEDLSIEDQQLLRDTQLTGHVDLTQLPASLTLLCLEHNRLSGTIDLTKLPEALTILYLDQNQLSGAVDLTKLPATLTKLRSISTWPRNTCPRMRLMVMESKCVRASIAISLTEILLSMRPYSWGDRLWFLPRLCAICILVSYDLRVIYSKPEMCSRARCL